MTKDHMGLIHERNQRPKISFNYSFKLAESPSFLVPPFLSLGSIFVVSLLAVRLFTLSSKISMFVFC
jgi:hypothetical protein